MGIIGWLAVAGAAWAALSAWIMYHLMVQNGRTLLRVKELEKQLIGQGFLPEKTEPEASGLPIGSLLNDFCLPALAGGTVTLSQWRGQRVLLIFVHPGCSFSRELLAALSALPEPASDPLPLIISTGDPLQNRRMFEAYSMPYRVLLQERSEVLSLYRLPGTPGGYLVDKNGATATAALTGAAPLFAQLRSVPAAEKARATAKFSRLAESHLVRDGLKAGTPAPDFTLPRLGGTELALRDYRGHKVLLVFSDPGCQPCMQLAPKLEEIHRGCPDLRVLMVSRGNVHDNEAKAAEYGLTFPIVLQRHWEISRAYGMFATPIGYLIDEKGVLASGVAAGGEAILELASARAVPVGAFRK